MSLSALAWGPGHPSIVTYDEAELLAYDSETEGPKWRLALDKRIAGVVLGDASGLDVGDAAAPFRTPAAVGAVLAIDVEGRLHAVDASSGRKLGDVGPFGAPEALAASSAGAGIAVAAAGKVHIWRKQSRAELSLDATALAFSNDGATLAVATEEGVIKMFDVSALDGQGNVDEIASFDARGPVSDLAQHPTRAWLVAGSRATLRIEGPGNETTLEKIPVGAKRLCFDPSGKRVAVQLSQRQVLVYEWPSLMVLTRIEYTERPVRGIAFGDGNWLGVAMDHGDGNKIDVETSAVHRTDTHPGREHRSWTLYVEGKKKELSAADEDAVRRMHEPSPPSGHGGGFGRGGRIGIITVISLCLLGLRICVRAGGSATSQPPYLASSSGYTPPTTCDRSCANERLERLKKDCATSPSGCADDVDDAIKALADGDCPKATAAVARVPKDSPSAPLLGVDKLLAEMGLREACADGSIKPKRITHPKLVRLVGPQLTESIEDIPEARPADGEKPRAAWTASDGTLFVGAVAGGSPPAVVIHQRSATGEWKIGFKAPVRDTDASVSIFGRSASDVYATVAGTLVHFDGKAWDGAPAPAGTIASLSGTANEVLIVVGDSQDADVYRRGKTDWIKEKAPNDLVFKDVRGGGPAAWAIGFANAEPGVAQRGADGSWSKRSPAVDGGSGGAFVNLWVSPTGDPFLLTDGTVVRGSNNGTKWVEDEMIVAGAVKALWGRSSSDVYAASFSRILHFDGKSWSSTTYVGKANALSGTAKEVFVLRADE